MPVLQVPPRAEQLPGNLKRYGRFPRARGQCQQHTACAFCNALQHAVEDRTSLLLLGEDRVAIERARRDQRQRVKHRRFVILGILRVQLGHRDRISEHPGLVVLPRRLTVKGVDRGEIGAQAQRGHCQGHRCQEGAVCDFHGALRWRQMVLAPTI